MVEHEPAVEIDLARVRAELALRAAELRAAGGERLERDVEAAVGDAVPGRPGDVQSLLRRAERQAEIDPLPPMGARPRPVRAAKQVVRRATVGPLTHLAAQVSALGATLVSASQALEARVARLERHLSGGSSPVPTLPGGVLDAVAAAAGEAAQGLTGAPVLHLGAGDGSLLARLAAAGLGGWGVESDAGLVLAARRSGLDVRLDQPGSLAGVADGSVGVVVLGPVVDVLTPGDLDALIRQARRALVPRGALVVTSFDPATFAVAWPVAHDLAPGRPLHVATWAHLLDQAGFGPLSVRTAEGDGGAVRILAAAVPAP